MNAQITYADLYLQGCNMLQKLLSIKPVTFESAAKTNGMFRLLTDMHYLIFYIPQTSYCIHWEDNMAKSNGDFNLIDYRLSDAELETFEAWLEREKPSFDEIMAELASHNYSAKLTYVENSEAWCISVTGTKDAKFNSSSTLTTWADTPSEGLAMAFFKVSEVFDWGKWKTKAQSRRG